MQIFNTFMKIAKTKIGTCSIYFVIYMVLLSLLSGSGNKTESSYTDYKCNLVVFDEDQTEASKQLTEYLTTLNNMVELENDEDVILNKLYFQNIDYVLYIRKGYATTGELENIKRPGSNSGNYVDSEILSFENCKKALLNAGYEEEEAYEKTLEALNTEGLVDFHKKNDGAEKPFLYYFFLYMPYVLLMMCFQGVIPILITFNKREISDRTSIAPIKSYSKGVQVFLGSLFFGFIILLFFMILGTGMTKGDILSTRGLLSLLNISVFMLVVIGLVNILGSFGLSDDNVSMCSNIVGLGMSFLGGLFVPIEIFSKGVLAVAKFMPTYWYLQSLMAVTDGKGVWDIAPFLGIELLFAVVFFAIAMLVSKRLRVHRAS